MVIEMHKIRLLVIILIISLLSVYIAIKNQYMKKEDIVVDQSVIGKCTRTTNGIIQRVFKGILYLRIRKCLKNILYGKTPDEVKSTLIDTQYDLSPGDANIVHDKIYEVYINNKNNTYIIVEYSMELFVEDIYYGE